MNGGEAFIELRKRLLREEYVRERAAGGARRTHEFWEEDFP